MYRFVVNVIIKRKKSVTNWKISDQTDLNALRLTVLIRSTTCTFHRISYNNTTLQGLGYLLTQRLSYALKMCSMNTKATTAYQVNLCCSGG